MFFGGVRFPPVFSDFGRYSGFTEGVRVFFMCSQLFRVFPVFRESPHCAPKM